MSEALNCSQEGSKSDKRMDSVSRILDATVHCVARYGYENASITHICNEAGVSRGLIHYHFENKEQLFVAAVRQIADGISQKLFQMVMENPASIANFDSLARNMYGMVLDSPEITSFMVELSAAANHNETLRKYYLEYREQQAQFIRENLEKALGAHLKSVPFDITLSIRLVEAVMLGVSVIRAATKDENQSREIFEGFLAMANVFMSLQAMAGTKNEQE